MKVIVSRYAEHVGLKLASAPYNLEILLTGRNKEKKRDFPDGDPFIQLLPQNVDLRDNSAIDKALTQQLEDEDIKILTSGQPRGMFCIYESEALVDLAERYNARSVEIFFMYFPMSMADAEFKPGISNLARKNCERFKDYQMYTIAPHFGNKSWVSEYRLEAISAEQLIINEINKHFDYSQYVPVACDVGEEERTGIPGFYKKRIDSNNVIVEASPELIKRMSGNRVALRDDIIETGNTAYTCGKVAKEYASEVIFIATHAVMSEGVSLVRSIFDEVYFTNTIARRDANVDITPVVYEVFTR